MAAVMSNEKIPLTLLSVVMKWARVLWLNGFTDLELISCSLQSIRIRAGPFRYEPMDWVADIRGICNLSTRLRYTTLFCDEVHDAFVSAESRSAETQRWERLCAPLDGHWDSLALSQRVPL